MKRDPEISKPATRASTRSQTLKINDDAKTRQKPTRTKGTGRVDKTRTKASDKTKGAASKPQPAPKTEPTTKGESEGAGTHVERKTSPPAPENVTVFTLTSDLVKNPIICHQYAPSHPSPQPHPPLIFTHGAGGTLSAPAMTHFSSGFSSTSGTPLLLFQGSMNLSGRTKGFHACHAHAYDSTGAKQPLAFGGRSMGARAAVIAATEVLAGSREQSVARLVLASYPLQGPKDVRDQILLDLPEGVEVLFIVGERDAMCPLGLLEETREKMVARSRVVVVQGADHGMNVVPAKRTRGLGEETGRVAARWLSGEIDVDGKVMHIGGEENA